MPTHKFVQLNFSDIIGSIKRHCAKISCAHVCTDIFYSLNAGRKIVENAKKQFSEMQLDN